jgi:protein-tyrosine phosphatase
MAEALATHYAKKRGWSVEVRSAGTMGLIDRQASPNAIRVMDDWDIDLRDHKSSAITDEAVAWADHILVMELRHQMHLHQRHQDSDGKVLQLGSFGGLAEVKDPIGGWKRTFRTSRDDLQRCVERFMDNLPPTPSAPIP